jgi:hypothetical protein
MDKEVAEAEKYIKNTGETVGPLFPKIGHHVPEVLFGRAS